MNGLISTISFSSYPVRLILGREPEVGVDSYVITGRIVGRGGLPVGGLHVRAYDRDPIWHDRLGNADTDAQGGFRIAFTAFDFREPWEVPRRSTWSFMTARSPVGNWRGPGRSVRTQTVGSTS